MPLTTQANIEQLLPLNYDATTDVLTAARWTALLAEVTGIVQDALPEFYPFNQTTDTPATPSTITHSAQYIGAWKAYTELIAVNAVEGVDGVLDRFKQMGFELLDAIRKEPDRWIRPETVTTETLTFGGSADWELDTDEAFLAVTSPLSSGDPPNIIEDTVRLVNTSSITGYTGAQIANMRWGYEYRTYWRKEYQRNVLKALRSDLYASGSSIKVTYQWDYRRERGVGQKAASNVLLNL